MRVLFLISLLALAGLLWASFAAARHIRQVRKRRRLARAAASTGSGQRRALQPDTLPKPVSSFPAQRQKPTPPPPAPLSVADWDEFTEMDPLSEVVHVYSPVRKSGSTARRPTSVSGDRTNGAAPLGGSHAETSTTAGAATDAPVARSQDHSAPSTYPNVARTPRTHSLHAHG